MAIDILRLRPQTRPNRLMAWLQREQEQVIRGIRNDRTNGYTSHDAFREVQDRENAQIAIRFGITPDAEVGTPDLEAWWSYARGQTNWLPRTLVDHILENFAPRPAKEA